MLIESIESSLSLSSNLGFAEDPGYEPAIQVRLPFVKGQEKPQEPAGSWIEVFGVRSELKRYPGTRCWNFPVPLETLKAIKKEVKAVNAFTVKVRL